MIKRSNTGKQNERGNVMWFILITIALMGSLMVILSRSSDVTEDAGDFEQSQINASNIMRNAKSYEFAVENLLAKGCGENGISFWHDSNGDGTENGTDTHFNNRSPDDRSCHVFAEEGAGLVYIPGWTFTGASRVLSVEEDTRTELLATFQTTQLNCMQINDLVGVANDADDAPSESFATTDFTGTFATTMNNANTIGNTSTALDGAYQGCSEDSGTYTYAHVLLAR